MEQKIVTDLKTSYGLNCTQFTPVSGGFLNKKWKTTSGKETLLVKQYSFQRFNLKQIQDIDAALQRQMLLEKVGVPCPHILPYQGHAIRMLDSETAYMVMQYCPGRIESPETVSPQQMTSLGRACGLIHMELGKMPCQGVKGHPMVDSHFLASLWDNFNARTAELARGVSDAYRNAVCALEAPLKTLNEDYLSSLPKGLAHEDFSPDNMLFHPEGVSAILDFDRNQYSFRWHDVGRTLLSFALKDNRLNLGLVHAFLQGYTLHMPLTIMNVADAFKITWCIEAPWWIQSDVFSDRKDKLVRFKEEVLWLTEHWFELESLLLE